MVKEAENLQTCTHYWMLEAPHGRRSKGRCKGCQATRRFFNRLEDCMLDLNRTPYLDSQRKKFRAGNRAAFKGQPSGDEESGALAADKIGAEGIF